jgi:hypothetical protein
MVICTRWTRTPNRRLLRCGKTGIAISPWEVDAATKHDFPKLSVWFNQLRARAPNHEVTWVACGAGHRETISLQVFVALGCRKRFSRRGKIGIKFFHPGASD